MSISKANWRSCISWQSIPCPLKERGLSSISPHNQNCSSFGRSKMDIPPASMGLISNALLKKVAGAKFPFLLEPSILCSSDCAAKDTSPLSKGMHQRGEGIVNTTALLGPEVKLSILPMSLSPISEAGSHSLCIVF